MQQALYKIDMLKRQEVTTLLNNLDNLAPKQGHKISRFSTAKLSIVWLGKKFLAFLILFCIAVRLICNLINRVFLLTVSTFIQLLQQTMNLEFGVLVVCSTVWGI